MLWIVGSSYVAQLYFRSSPAAVPGTSTGREGQPQAFPEPADNQGRDKFCEFRITSYPTRQVLWVLYIIIPVPDKFCEFGTTSPTRQVLWVLYNIIPYPKSSVSSVQHHALLHQFCEFCMTLYPDPTSSVSSVQHHTLPDMFCEFCTTSYPYLTSSASSVQHHARPDKFCEFDITSYPYPTSSVQHTLAVYPTSSVSSV